MDCSNYRTPAMVNQLFFQESWVYHRCDLTGGSTSDTPKKFFYSNQYVFRATLSLVFLS